MSKEKNLKNLVWILIVIILLTVSFIVYDKVLSVDKDITPLEPEVDTEVIEELEEKVEEAKDDDGDDDVKELEEKIEDLEEKVEDLEDEVEEKEETIEDNEESINEEAVVYSGENFIKVISPNDGAGFSTEPVEFTGEVSPNTEKIVVTVVAEGTSPPAVKDVYQLQNFNYGDESFVYRASTEWDNLFNGGYIYQFEAYFDDGGKESTEIYISYGVMENYITVDSPVDGKKFNINELPIEFTGSVSKNTTKIVVTATATNPKCVPDVVCTASINDVYTLKDFKHGDTSFIYRAKTEWGNLIESPEKNHYTFTAHFDDGSTETVSIGVNFFPYF